jgi:chorismate mutase
MTSAPSKASSLARLRQEIESVDRSIVLLLAARLDAARRAIRLRAGGQCRMTDRDQERRVFLRSLAWAEELRLPPKLVENLFRSLIEEGKARFLSEESPPAPPVVTVLLRRPKDSTVRLEGERSTDPAIVPPPR